MHLDSFRCITCAICEIEMDVGGDEDDEEMVCSMCDLYIDKKTMTKRELLEMVRRDRKKAAVIAAEAKQFAKRGCALQGDDPDYVQDCRGKL